MTIILTFALGFCVFLSLHYLNQKITKTHKPALSSKEKKIFNTNFTPFLSDVLRLISAGLPLKDALEIAAKDADSIVSGAILGPLTSIGLGENPQQAWEKAQKLYENDDFDYFVLILLLQQEVGGKMGDLLSKLIEMRRSRIKLIQKIKALTAEGRLSGIILALLPPFVLGGLFVLSPTYIKDFLNHDSSAFLLMLAGFFWLSGVYVLIKLNQNLGG